MEDKELDLILRVVPDDLIEWYFFNDDGETHTTHTAHDFFRFAHAHRDWGYTNLRPSWIAGSALGEMTQ